MLATNATRPELIAPCGVNCRLCRAYIRDKAYIKPCPGCRGGDANKSRACVECKIKNCAQLVNEHLSYCFECVSFPCARIKHLDKRYRTRYGASMVENLRSIQQTGIEHFVESENTKWTCPECGAMICMHKPYCLSCGYVWNK